MRLGFTGVAVAMIWMGLPSYGAHFTDAMVIPRWPVSPLVDLYYTISGLNGSTDVRVGLESEDVGIHVSDSALTGDVLGVSNGFRHVVWDPRIDFPEPTRLRNVKFVPSEDPVLYLIVNLEKAGGEAGSLTYVRARDLHAGTYGTVVTNPVSGIESFVWTGVTEDDAYRTTKMVFRRIYPGRVHDAAANMDVVVDHGYWISVFEMTQGQMKRVNGGTDASKWRRGEAYAGNQTFDYLRGTGQELTADCFIGKFQAATGLAADLPTAAEWRYAARAGSTTLYTDNQSSTPKDEPFIHTLGNLYDTSVSGGYVDKKVGSFSPNAWGLYDVLGNMAEWVLDATTSGNRQLLGSSRMKSDLSYAVLTATVFENKPVTDGDTYNLNGFRLVIHQ